MNVTRISGEVNEYNRYYKNLLKNPDYRWKHLFFMKQTESEFEAFDWSRATGIGSVTEFEQLRVIDVDGCTSTRFIEMILECLWLPSYYEWVVKTGSGDGFHIFFRSARLDMLEENDAVTTFPPRKEFSYLANKIEILWTTHIVLPPSLHKSGNHYSFLQETLPSDLPTLLPIDLISKFILEVCNPDRMSTGTGYFAERPDQPPPLRSLLGG